MIVFFPELKLVVRDQEGPASKVTLSQVGWKVVGDGRKESNTVRS